MDTSELILNYKTFDDILAERKYQVSKGFTKDSDDNKMPHEWLDLVSKYVNRVEDAETPEAFRAMFVKVAAIAVAALEAYDRTI